MGSTVIPLVSGYLTPRTRSRLAADDISYVDMAGNVRLVMRMPALFIETTGAARPRGASAAAPPQLSGACVASLVRFLAEVTPPYGVSDIARATGVSAGYVSKVLGRLADDALIERERRGPVTAVDWPALLRLRAEFVDLFESDGARRFIAPNGAAAAYEQLGTLPDGVTVVVTGSYAARKVAPVAAPSVLVCYVAAPDQRSALDDVARTLRLLPADECVDVVLLPPSDESVLVRPRRQDGLAFVNLPQLVVDGLSGTGRMPAEAEAVLDWMQRDPDRWRYPSIDDFRQETS